MKSFLQPRCKECGHKLSAPRKASAKTKAYKKINAEQRAAARRSRNESTGKVYRAVMRLADGYCECCGLPDAPWAPLEMDHFFGGRGQRRQRQSVQTCWALCRPCHRLRTDNWPTAEHWNGKFKLRLARHHFPIPVLHVEHAPVPNKGTQPKAAPKSLASDVTHFVGDSCPSGHKGEASNG